MTNPLGQGSSSWARTTRFADLAWGMPRKKVLAMYTAARTFPRYEVHNPRTGEPVSVRESVALPSSPPPVHGVPVHATVTFDDADHLDSITLKSESPRPEDVTDAALLVAANKVAAALGIEPIAAVPDTRQTWTIKTTRVVLERDDECFWFELSPTS